MNDSESEDDIVSRIETALGKIAVAARAPKPPSGRHIDRAALAQSLDLIIARLRTGIEQPKTGI